MMFLLEAEYEKRKKWHNNSFLTFLSNPLEPQPSDRILINPVTGRPLTRPRLYQRMISLGRRAGVSNAHPHRFRDTLAVDMLARGASPHDVAKILGDTIGTVEKHYMPFIGELRERVRMILETGVGVEKSNETTPRPSQYEAKDRTGCFLKMIF